MPLKCIFSYRRTVSLQELIESHRIISGGFLDKTFRNNSLIAYQEVHLILQKEGDKKCENSSPLELGEPHETKGNEKCKDKLRSTITL